MGSLITFGFAIVALCVVFGGSHFYEHWEQKRKARLLELRAKRQQLAREAYYATTHEAEGFAVFGRAS